MTLYDILRTNWRRERSEDKLVPLETEFFEKVRNYINHLEVQSQNEPDELLADLFEKRWIRANFLINDIINIRMDKHIRDSRNNAHKPDSLPSEEEEFRDRLDRLLGGFRDQVLGIELETTESYEDLGDDESAYQLVRFTKQEHLTSIGADLKSYGPFDQGDFAFLPVENARNYLKRSQVENIQIQ